MFWLKTPGFVTTNMSGNCSEMTSHLEISVVSSLAAISVTSSPPPHDMKAGFHKHVVNMVYIVEMSR